MSKMLINPKLVFLYLFLFCLAITSLQAQEPPHPPSGNHGLNGNQPAGGNARVGDGIGIVIAFALAYSYRKLNRTKKNNTSNKRTQTKNIFSFWQHY